MKNLVAMMVTVVMAAGALVGCGSVDTVQETGSDKFPVGTTAEASVEETTTEYVTEEASVEVVEEVPQTEERKVLAGSLRFVNNEVTDVMSYRFS